MERVSDKIKDPFVHLPIIFGVVGLVVGEIAVPQNAIYLAVGMAVFGLLIAAVQTMIVHG